MAYRDCSCLKCNSGKEREKRIECRRKCTQFVAWKLSMQAIRQKKKEDKDKYYSTTKKKFYERKLMKQKSGENMMNPCEACAEIICMGICADRVKYNDYLDGIRQQLIELCERVRNDRERKEREKERIS